MIRPERESSQDKHTENDGWDIEIAEDGVNETGLLRFGPHDI